MHSVNQVRSYVEEEISNGGSSFLTNEEEHLLARARAGNAAAFESLVMPHRDAIFRLTKRILRNREDAEDAVQTAFLDALRHLHAFQGRSRFSSWLTRIALNAAFMRLRASRRKSETSLDEMTEGETSVRFTVVETRPNPEQECSAQETRALLAKALDRLGPIYAEVVQLRDVKEMSAREAAQILGVPVGTLKARLHRGRTRLSRHVHSMLKTRTSRMLAQSRLRSEFASTSYQLTL
jgi:RNA polymerase sigma-70 factor, ECF subfamily